MNRIKLIFVLTLGFLYIFASASHKSSTTNFTASQFSACSFLCPSTISPVCGTNGVTYRNSCYATRCAGVGVACNRQCPCLTTTPGGCFCPQNFDPVCGADGRTYPNSCVARCAGVSVSCRGQCPCRFSACPLNCDPVCGADGRTYLNSCFASQGGTTSQCRGTCPCTGGGGTCEASCPLTLNPVCGRDGTTYRNTCFASCNNAVVQFSGACPRRFCGCPTNVNPVCGRNGITYRNQCEAFCARTTVACNQICPCTPFIGIAEQGGMITSPEISGISGIEEGAIGGQQFAAFGCDPNEFNQVCGSNGVTYQSPCFAQAAGVTVLFFGSC